MRSIDLETVNYATGPGGKLILCGLRHKERQNKRAVLFVHGLTGDPEFTWSTPSGVNFMHLIAHDEDLADYDTFSFGYHTSFLNGSRIENVALQLADEIHENLTGYNLVLIAHSLGGLVCMRYVLDRLVRHRSLPILGLLLYGAPTTGTDLINIAKKLGFILQFTAIGTIARLFDFLVTRHSQFEELASASAFVRGLRDQWSLRVVNGGDASLREDERAWLPVRVVTAEKDFFVSEASAKSFYGEVDWHPLAFSHTALVKPEARNDVRYQRAREFLKVCRRAKEGKVLGQVWKESQTVWNYHKERLIKGWRYVVEIHSQAENVLDPMLKAAGFSPCAVECQYTTVLEQPEIRVAVSLGQIAAKQLWKQMRVPENESSRPAYVHGLHVEKLSENERRKINDEIVSILSKTDLEASWRLFFPALSVALSAGESKIDIHLPPGKIVRESTSLVRSFFLPPDRVSVMGEDVTIKINYQSVVPQAMPSFHVRFPWLTQRCLCEIIVRGDTEYFVWTSHLVGEPEMEIASEEQGRLHKLMFQSDDLVLPGSRIDLQWQLRAAPNGR